MIGVLADEDRSGKAAGAGAVPAAADFGGLAGIVGLDDPTPDLNA